MRSRSTSILKASLEHNLLTYAAAASTAGISAFAATPAAEAKVIYTPTHVVIKVNDSYRLDLNQDGITDFVLRNTVHCNTDQCFWDLNEKALRANGFLGSVPFQGFPPFVSALSKGAEIGPGGRFYNGRGQFATFYYGGGGPSSGGQWLNVQKRYTGLKVKINGEIHYGWARLNVKVTDNPISITGTLTGYAYETKPNKPIVAGDTAGGSLGHLALGASGTKSFGPVDAAK